MGGRWGFAIGIVNRSGYGPWFYLETPRWLLHFYWRRWRGDALRAYGKGARGFTLLRFSPAQPKEQ